MKLYQLFYMDDAGKIIFDDLHADSDEEAEQMARDMKLGAACQVWDRTRRIATIPKYPG